MTIYDNVVNCILYGIEVLAISTKKGLLKIIGYFLKI
jgi:hypothetical protein